MSFMIAMRTRVGVSLLGWQGLCGPWCPRWMICSIVLMGLIWGMAGECVNLADLGFFVP